MVFQWWYRVRMWNSQGLLLIAIGTLFQEPANTTVTVLAPTVVSTVAPRPYEISTPFPPAAPLRPTEIPTLIPAFVIPEKKVLEKETIAINISSTPKSKTNSSNMQENLPLILTVVGVLVTAAGVALVLATNRKRSKTASIKLKGTAQSSHSLEELMGNQHPRNIIPTYTPPKRASETEQDD